MHERFKVKFKELNLSLAEVETKIKCHKNYLSRFINGKGTKLPHKWEVKIDAFISGIEKELANIPVKNPDLLRPWIKIIEEYCKGAGIEPEDLVDAHKALKVTKTAPKPTSPAEVKVTDLSTPTVKSNYTINTGSQYTEELWKKKMGIK